MADESKPAEPGPVKVYQDREFEILQTQYVEQAANLRNFNDYDLKVVGGFLALELGLASWLATTTRTFSLGARCAIFMVNFAALIACCRILSGARRRRRETGTVIQAINEAFGLYQNDVYLKGKAIKERLPLGNPF